MRCCKSSTSSCRPWLSTLPPRSLPMPLVVPILRRSRRPRLDSRRRKRRNRGEAAASARAAMADPRFFARSGPFSLEALAGLTEATLRDPKTGGLLLTDVAPLESAGPEDLTFLDNRKYLDAFARSRAGAAFVDERAIGSAPAGMALLVAPNPYKAFARAAQAFYPLKAVAPRRAPSAVIDPAANVPSDCDMAGNVV